MLTYPLTVSDSAVGPEIEIDIAALNLHIPGSTLIVSGLIDRFFAGAPAPTTLQLQLRDAGGVTRSTRFFNLVDFGGDSSKAGVFAMFSGFLALDVPLWSAYRLFLVDTTAAASTLTYDLTLNNSIGSLLPPFIYADLNAPPVFWSDQPSMMGAGTSISGGMNVSLNVANLQGTILGQATTGRFTTWCVDLTLPATAVGPTLTDLRIKLYLSNGVTKEIDLQDIPLGPPVARRIFFVMAERSSAYATYADFFGACSDAGVAGTIRSGVLPLNLVFQPLNYERL